MHASSQDQKTWLARMAELQHSNNEGYWGVYRNRLADSKKDDFSSPYITSSTPKRTDESVSKLTLNLSDTTEEVKHIRRGRVYLPKGIDNLVSANTRIILAYQHSSRTYIPSSWRRMLRLGSNYLDKERSKNGILSCRTSVGIEGAEIETGTPPSPVQT